jgi:hypothetical protein
MRHGFTEFDRLYKHTRNQHSSSFLVYAWTSIWSPAIVGSTDTQCSAMNLTLYSVEQSPQFGDLLNAQFSDRLPVLILWEDYYVRPQRPDLRRTESQAR